MKLTFLLLFVLLINTLHAQSELGMSYNEKHYYLSYSYQALNNDTIAYFLNNFFKQEEYFVNFDRNTIKENKIKKAVIYTKILNDRKELKQYLNKKKHFKNDTITMIVEFDTNGRVIKEKIFTYYFSENNIYYNDKRFYQAKIFYENQKIKLRINNFFGEYYINEYTIENNQVTDFKVYFCRNKNKLISFLNNEYKGTITLCKKIKDKYDNYYEYIDNNGNIITTDFLTLPNDSLFLFTGRIIDGTKYSDIKYLNISNIDDDWDNSNDNQKLQFCKKERLYIDFLYKVLYVKNKKNQLIKEINIDIDDEDDFYSFITPNCYITEIKYDNKDRKKLILYDYIIGKGVKKYSYTKNTKKVEGKLKHHSKNLYKTSYLKKEKNSSTYIKYKKMEREVYILDQICDTKKGKFVYELLMVKDTNKYEVIINYTDNEKKLPQSTVYIISEPVYKTVIIDPDDCFYCSDTIRIEQVKIEKKIKNKIIQYDPKQDIIYYNSISYEYFE